MSKRTTYTRILSLISLIGFCQVGATAPMVELFTSQGCYSCPPADEFLAKIIKDRPEVVALEYHVDYWDDLHYGSAGVWKDPFSDPAYTARQREYNTRRLEGRPGVYTPQMIINGHTAQVGNSRRAVIEALNGALPPLKVLARQSGTEVTINAAYDATQWDERAKAALWFALFDKQQETRVANGENHGKTMRNHNVVRQLIPLSDFNKKGFAQTLSVPELSDANKGCAVFIQVKNHGPILAADYCQTGV
jgi:hypothetical protein